MHIVNKLRKESLDLNLMTLIYTYMYLYYVLCSVVVYCSMLRFQIMIIKAFFKIKKRVGQKGCAIHRKD